MKNSIKIINGQAVKTKVYKIPGIDKNGNAKIFKIPTITYYPADWFIKPSNETKTRAKAHHQPA